MALNERETLISIWWEAVRAVQGEQAVAQAIEEMKVPRPDAIVAVGKAAASMARAAFTAFGSDLPALVLTKYGHLDGTDLPPGVEARESAHPVPDGESLRSGARLLEFVSGLKGDDHLLMLVSGGASALVEVPEPGWTLKSIADENRRLLAEGLDIHAMNDRRRRYSRIKGGRLLSRFPGHRVTTLAISDVEGDDLNVIGSGIGAAPEGPAFDFNARIAASNAIARMAAQQAAEALDLPVLSNDETLYDDVRNVARTVSATLDGAKGIRIWGGEPTVVLPDAPGEGGRNQALALELAKDIAGRPGLFILVAGTDGSDGPTNAAGGLVDGAVWTGAAQTYLDRADSGSYLASKDALFTSGPTGTNVMDLLIALQR